MKTRIDHATVLTCRNREVAVLKDTSVVFEDGVITYVGPISELDVRSAASEHRGLAVGELKGRPLGAILVRMGVTTREQVARAVERQRNTHGVIGNVLVQMGYVTEADVEIGLAVQAGRLLLPEGDDATVIDGSRSLLVPGLINTHHHLFQSLTRCMPIAQNLSLFDWLERLYPIWREMDYDAMKQASIISMAELLLTGCTTTSDHAYLFPRDRDAKIEAVLEAAEMLGMRIHAGRGSMDLGQSAGGLPPDDCTQSADEILADSQRVIDLFHDPAPLAMRRIDLAPCAPFSVTPELLDATRELAAQYGLLLHTHIAETSQEKQYCLERFSVSPIGYLHQHGWLADNVYLAHCVHLSDDEIDLLARTGTAVAHCPSSNMRLASGIAPVRKMIDAGIKVGLGVDGASSNDGGNLLSEARLALLSQRAEGDPAGLTADEAFRLATVGGAQVLHRPQLGQIEPGCAADLALFDMDDVAMAGAVAHDLAAALMLAQPPRPQHVFIAGRPVVWDGQIAGLNRQKVVRDFNHLVSEKFCGLAGANCPLGA